LSRGILGDYALYGWNNPFHNPVLRIRDPGWVKNLDPRSGSGMNNPDHISESLETIFWVKILKFFDADPGSEMEKIAVLKNFSSMDPPF
jgi:hypothetical protein